MSELTPPGLQLRLTIGWRCAHCAVRGAVVVPFAQPGRMQALRDAVDRIAREHVAGSRGRCATDWAAGIVTEFQDLPT